jgi:hypothetical protein
VRKSTHGPDSSLPTPFSKLDPKKLMEQSDNIQHSGQYTEVVIVLAITDLE